MERNSLLQIVITMIIPIIVVIGAFFTLQADQRHLQYQLAQDEVRFDNRLDILEVRLRDIELDTNERLTRIETRLETIQNYMVMITERLDKLALEKDENQ